MPEKEAAWVAGIRTAATAAGWQHKLWTWAELEARYGGEAVCGVFRRALAEYPQAFSYTLAADYYRLRVLADAPGLYLDTDFECCGTWPDFTAAPTIGLLGEFFARTRPGNCILLAKDSTPFALAAEMAAKRILDRLDPASKDFPAQLVALVRRDKGGSLPAAGCGPRWLVKCVLPAWDAAGFQHGFLPPATAAHRQWHSHAALVHHGTAHWHEGGRESAYWDAMARHAHQQALPAHLRPQGSCIVPPRRTTDRPAAATAPALPFRIPAGTRRIVVLSNVATGFPWERINLQAGDLVIHCNHATHRQAAMAVAGTRHWLFVRHGRGRDPRGWHWYAPTNMDGFEKVFFVDDAAHITPFRWAAEYRAITAKSPTTGFLVANAMREVAPTLPLVLAGFDPGIHHGTPQWDGHDWQAERAWYSRHGFCLLPPAASFPRVLVLVTSCHQFIDRTIRAKTADGCYRARKACRLGWMRRLLPEGMQAFFIVGNGPANHEPRVVQVDAPDDYAHLPAKVLAGMRWALAHHEFDYLVKVDDDTFLHPTRLAAFVATLPQGTPDIYGGASREQDFNLCGGAGYILSRAMLAKVVADPAIPAIGAEDREICASVLRQGGRVIKDARFNKTNTPWPTMSNDLISAHTMTPARMHRAHTDCFKL